MGELTCSDHDFERFMLRSRGFNAIFCIITVYGIDLLHYTPDTGH